MPYHTLLQRIDDDWTIQFGAYDKDDVQFEHDDYKRCGVPKHDLKIVRTKTARQSEIESILAKLNHKARYSSKPCGLCGKINDCELACTQTYY